MKNGNLILSCGFSSLFIFNFDSLYEAPVTPICKKCKPYYFSTLEWTNPIANDIKWTHFEIIWMLFKTFRFHIVYVILSFWCTNHHYHRHATTIIILFDSSIILYPIIKYIKQINQLVKLVNTLWWWCACNWVVVVAGDDYVVYSIYHFSIHFLTKLNEWTRMYGKHFPNIT